MKSVTILMTLVGISSRALGQGQITQALFPNENAHQEDVQYDSPLPPVDYLQLPAEKSISKSEPYPAAPAPSYGLPPPAYYRITYEKSPSAAETPSYQPIPLDQPNQYSKSPEQPLRQPSPPVPTLNEKIPTQPSVEFPPSISVSPIAPIPITGPILPLLPLPPMPMMGD